MTEQSDTIELGALADTVRRGWRQLLAAVLLATGAALAVLAFAPRRFEGNASVLLRSNQDLGGSLLARAGIPTELAPSGMAGGLKSTLETELQLLASREVLGAVVDSLGLQARVTSPRTAATDLVVAAVRVPGSFRRVTLDFERQADGSYAADVRGRPQRALPGRPMAVLNGTMTLGAGPLPPRFTVKLEDHDDAVTRLAEHLSIDKKGGEVAGIGYAAADSLRAASVPNAIVAVYLDRRRTVDRGVNQRRLEFLRIEADSISRALAGAEEALRREQERSGVIDPELTGRVGLESGRTIREQLGAVEVERHALGQMLDQVANGTLTPRQLAAYPNFLRSDAINALLSQMATLETERLRYLERRTEADPEVLALTASVRNLEQQLVPLGRAYAGALDRQGTALQGQLDVVGGQLAALPQQAERSLRLAREVKRLGQTVLALQTQMLDAELAAIGEGGQVRQIDVASAPKRPRFPRPVPTLLFGLGLGLAIGVVWALARAAFGRTLRGEGEIARATGLPVVRLERGRPLLIGRLRPGRAVLVVPIDGAVDARPVALRIAARDGDVLDAGDAPAVADGLPDPALDDATRLLDVRDAGLASSGAVRRTLAALEAHGAPVVAALPAIGDARTTPLLATQRPLVLVAPARPIERAPLLRLLAGLRDIEAIVTGIVLVDADAHQTAARRNGRGPAARSPEPAGIAAALERRDAHADVDR